MLELAVAASLFLLAAAILSLVVAESVATNVATGERQQIEAQLQTAATKIVNAPNAYNLLLTNTFSPPSACNGSSGSGSNVQSCFSVNNQVFRATWSVTAGASDPLSQTTQTAASETLTGTVTVSPGTVVSVSRLVNAPSYGYELYTGVLRVQVNDPGSLLAANTPIYLLSMASPSTVVASAPLSNGVAVMRVTAASCTLTSPCVLGLSSGNDYATNGTASMIASQVTGTDADIVLTAGQATYATLQVRGVGTATLSLTATNTATTEPAMTNPVVGSVCLYANFDDGTALQAAPVCNWQNPESITLSDYAPDPTRPNVRMPFPLNTPISFTTDLLGSNKNSTSCPTITNPYSSGPSSMVGWTGSAWAATAECTSYTWGTPSTITIGGYTSAWSAGAGLLSLSAGTNVTGSINWIGSGNAANLFVADAGGNSVRMATPGAVVSSFSSSGLSSPGGMVVDSSGNVYVANTSGNTILRIAATGGSPTVIAGQATAGYTNAVGTAAQFNAPRALALNAAGTQLYVADAGNNVVRVVNLSTYQVTTLATTGVTLSSPSGLAVSSAGTVYIADSGDNRIIVDQGGVATVLAGSGTASNVNGTGTGATFNNPWGLSLNSSGTTLYVADQGNNEIRQITTASGVVTTLAGNGSAGSANGTGSAATFNAPRGVVAMSNGTIYVADYGNNLIRSVTSAGVVSTFAGSGSAAETNGTGTAAAFNGPGAIASYGGWQVGQPAVGFGTVASWTMPRTTPACGSSATCTSVGTGVPENSSCTNFAVCDVAAVPYVTSPQTGGQVGVAITGTAPVTTTFTLAVADYSGNSVTVKATGLPSVGTFENSSGTAITSGSTIGSLSAGGGTITLKYVEPAGGLSASQQPYATISLTDGGATVSQNIAFYRTANPWIITGYGASVAQGSSTPVQAGIVLANGSLATTSSATFSCSGSCPTGLTFSGGGVASGETGGVASVTATTTSATPAGTYSIIVTSNGMTGTAHLTVTQVPRAVAITSLSPTTAPENSTVSVTAKVTDGAGNAVANVPVAFVVTKSGVVTAGVYAGVGGCVTGVAGTCSITGTSGIVVDPGAAAGTYTVTAIANGYSSASSLAVTLAPGSVSAGSISVNQGSTGSEAVAVYDGTGAPMSGQTVTFSSGTTGLSVGNSSTTSASGTATATVTVAGTVAPGTYSVTASDASASTSFNVTVVASAGSVTGSALSITRGSSATETVTVKDSNGYVIPGAIVSYVSSVSGITVVPNSTTGSGGTASVAVYVAKSVSAGTYSGAITITSGAKTYLVTVTVS